MKTQTRIGLAVGLTLALLAAGAARAGVVASGGNYTNLSIPGYRIHVFTNSATASNFYVRAGGYVEVLVVAGGGGGGGAYFGGGGGGGGLIYSNVFPVEVNSNYLVTVGAGGNGVVNASGANGSNSVFATITATGGGGGGANSVGNGSSGGNGGSGGGASGYDSTSYGTNLPAGQGNQGGVGRGGAGGKYGGGGGGGAGSIGLNGQGYGGAGGTGAVYLISGTATYYAGGGGGAGFVTGDVGGAGGLGGGGQGADGTSSSSGSPYYSPSNGIPNTGGGGGGANGYPHSRLGWCIGGKGGSGIVIVRYATPLGVMALPVSNLQTGGGTLNGIVTGVGTNGAADAENPYVYFCWDSSDKGTNNFPGTWTHADLMGTNWGFGQSFSTNLTGLSGTTVYRCFASNSTGIAWSDTQSFTLVTAPAVTNLGVGTYGRTWATLRGQVTDTGGETPRVTFEYWPAAGGTTNALDAGTQAGACSRTATLLAPATQYSYWVIASNAGGRVWSEAKTFTTLAAGVPQTATWDNGGGDGKWSTASNWVGDAVPLPGDAVVFDTTSTSNCAANVVSNNLGSLTLDTGYAGTVTFATNAVAGGMTLAVTGDIVVRQGNIALTGDPTANAPYGAGYTLQAANLSISNGASINADGKGFTTATRGPGTPGVSNKGATHGGVGWANTTNTYGSATSPTSLGSATAGANGGGAIKLMVSGNLIVNGTLSADGANDWQGSGAGGGIWIATGGTLSGSGTISAKSTGSVPGGGGRIAIDDAVTYNFTGNILGGAAGSSGAGNPGSVRLPENQAITVVTNQTLVLGNGEYNNVFSDLTIANGGRVEVGGIPQGLGTGSVIRAVNLNIQTGGVLTADYRGFGYSVNNQWYTGPGTPGAQDKGATHGGIGYNNTTNTYGSITSPTSLGSDGYQAFGGGAIKLIVSGNLIVNGALSANGASDWQGCGSGGSLWIENGNTLSGNGLITANGGGGTSGGGGGRIAIMYGASSFTGLPAVGLYTNQQSISSTVTVKGGYNTGADGVEDGSIYVVARPTITVGNATNPAAATVSLLASLTSTGGAPTTVFGYWGTNGTNWNATTNLGVSGAGTITNTIAGVSADALYTFAFMASNSAGATTTGTNTFTLANVTLATAPAGLSVGGDSATNATPWTNYWLADSAHALSVPSPQTNGMTRYLFGAWSDGGAQSHSYTASVSQTVTAQFTTQYLWSVTVAPPGAGSVDPATTWTNAGATLAVTATPADGNWVFDHWSGDMAGTSGSTNVVMNSGLAVTANFAAAGNAVVIGSSPAGRSVAVDGVVTSEPPAYVWQNGSVHTVAVAGATQYLDSSNRYTFVQWEDGTTATQRVLTVSAATNLTATFQREYLWIWTATPAGVGYVTPAAGGWYATGATFTATAVATGTAPFKAWSGDASGSNTTASITMSGPKSVTAAFYVAPVVDNGGGATNIGLTNATLQATLISGDPSAVGLYWWPSGGTTNVVDFGTVSQAVPLQTNVVGLTYDTTYYYQAFASNVAGTALAAVTNFATLPFLRITNSLTLVESQTNLYAAFPVVLDGSNVVLSLSNSAVVGNLPVYRFKSLTVTNGATVLCLGQGALAPYNDANKGVAISADSVTIATNSSINADGKGFTTATRGPGTPDASSKGATHGGIGWANTTNTYGSSTSPTSLGSATAGANGGGAIKLIVSGNLIVNGTLSADGAYDWLGSGSGGSIWIATGGTLSGSGTISAKSSGTIAGGGGRIAIDDAVTYNFTGNILCDRAGGSTTGNPGSLRLPQNQAITVVSNQTLVLGDGVFTNVFSDLTIANGGRVEVGGIPMGLGTGSVIRAANVNIQTGGVLTADYRGFGYSVNNQSYTGPGTPGAQDKGATHGGIGYNNTTNTYGSITSPTSLGSDGYQAFGGGAIQLIVSGNLTVNGTLSANGASDWQGCGSGGSLWIESLGPLSGNGVISANGGGGISGGGGGRIAIYYASSSFAGLPAVGLYTNQQLISSTVAVKGGYNTGTDGLEDGSIFIEAMMTGTIFKFR